MTRPAALRRRAAAALHALGVLSATVLAAACDRPAAASADAAPAGPKVIGEIIPVEEQLRQFRVGLAPVDTLAGGAPTREALVRRFVAALERRDTAALRAMHLSRAEYAYLYYPTAAVARPPQQLDPESAWLLLTLESDKGVRRALTRVGGRPLGYAGHACAAAPVVEEANRSWQGCTVRWRAAEGALDSVPLFGPIVERAGRFKFVSYRNKL
jgi:hypothetical protein